ncbi:MULTISPECIES: TonB-dependent receptor [unclassified Microbulbifer]|uniref:TonB-dependent receptor n=1 Tax=unclassified Microbulbifer TaxID=2619833 RepID=UPI001E34B6CF|nr:TonB-dependent receptor [Microbulbifer sp. YPW16]UHQ54939.1 TonB-dependent receptor [Microbulbifer sp. YPW16]
MKPVTFKRARLPLAIALVTPLAGFSLSISAAESALEEITVTAQKREQNSLDVPITVDTFSSDDIVDTGALTLNEMDAYIPGFDAGDGLTQASLSIRGISSPNISAGGDPSVSTFYDDAYLPSAATTIAFSDMARVEVLKGPQGTLFGRNSAAGTLSLVPRQPSEDFEAFVSTKIGNYGLVRNEGMVNAPVTDSLYVRANLLTNQRDGYIENASGRDSGEQDVVTGRISALWDVSEATDLQLSYDWDQVDNSPRAAVGFSDFALNTEPYSRRVANDLIRGEETRDMYAINAKLFHDFSDTLSVKAVHSYRAFETTNREEEDGTAEPTVYLDTNNRFDNDISYSEVQFNYNTDTLNAVFGANYSSESIRQDTTVTALADSAIRVTTTALVNDPTLQGMIEAGTIAAANAQTAPAVQAGLISQAEADAIASAAAADSLAALASIDHLWAPGDWATFTTLLGQGVLPQDGVYYDAVAQALGTSMLFGPEYAGMTWQESVINEGEFVNYGFYADAEYAFTDRFRLSAGLRYSHDNKEFSWLVPGVDFSRPTVPGTAPIEPLIFRTDDGYVVGDGQLEAEDNWSKVTGRLVGQYDITDQAMVFLSYATGYKSGGFDSLDQSSAANPIKPEEVENIELGLKGDLFDNRARVQLSYFDMTVDNRQRSVETLPPGQTNALPRVINGDQRIDGIEVTFDWLPVDTVRLGLVTTLRDTESEWESFYNARGELQSDRENDSADTAYTLTFNWSPEVSFGSVDLYADYIYAENSAESDPAAISSVMIAGVDTPIPGFGEDTRLLNTRLSWMSDSEQYEVALWGRNLLENEVTGSVGGRTLDVFGTGFLGISAPRTYGLDLRYNF